ncbi:MAG: hypothetical protein QM709_11185 [Spongiibacteraceae bacterium]
MRAIIVLSALVIVACSQPPDSRAESKVAAPQSVAANKRPSFSPSAPVNLSYRVDEAVAGQPQRVELTINTRLNSGCLLVEVAKQEGVDVIDKAAQRIDLANTSQPIELQMQAIQLGSGEHYFVLLLTVETGMGPMSRTFRIDLTPASPGESD